MGHSLSLIFPRRGVEWVNLRLEIPNHDDIRHLNEASSFLFIVFKNFTSLVSDKSGKVTDLAQPLRLISPVVSFTSANYKIPSSADFSLSFNLSLDTVQKIQSNEINVTCAKLLTDNPDRGISWQSNDCFISGIIKNRTVECSCEHFGQYAILAYPIEKVKAKQII